MSSSQPKSRSNANPHINEEQWVIHISTKLEEKLEEIESPITIFNVPRPLKDIHPKSYIPQLVAIGPCHSALLEIHDMERYKLAAAKRNQKDKLHKFFQVMEKSEPKIRATYQTLLDLSGKTLAWMMVLDASFLLEFLLDCVVKEKEATDNVISSSLSHVASLKLNKATRNAILRDVSLVDNQIPLFVLRELLELYFTSFDKVDEVLFSMLEGVCIELSPFKMADELNRDKVEVEKFDHLLDFLYHFVVTRLDGTADLVQEEVVLLEELPINAFHRVKSALSILRGPATLVKKVIFSKPVKFVVKLPWKIFSKLPIMPMGNHHEHKDDEITTNAHVSPLLEEIDIPSVTQLAKVGVRFQPTSEGIYSISFDCKNRIFYLPTINLDVNSSVVLRNLVAYEVCSSSGPLILSRYIELINGIIDTKEDAKYLRERGIVVNRVKSDDEVANLWNGMSKSIRLTKVPFLDKIIEDVNKDYSKRWIVKFNKCLRLRSYIYKSWRLLTLLGAMLMIIFTGLQTFCSIYNCSHIVPIAHLSR